MNTGRREFLKSGGAVVVAFSFGSSVSAQQLPGAAPAAGRTLALDQVDAFLAIDANGRVTIYSGKVDLGQGLRVAIPQMVAEELGCGVEQIAWVEGDTALTPDQGPTAGSTGIMRGGVQVRQAAATAREALLGLAAVRLGKSRGELDLVNGEVHASSGATQLAIGELVGDRRFNIKLDAKATLKDPAAYKVVGKPLRRPDVPAKVTGRHPFVHDMKVNGMMYATVVRPQSVGATLVDVDEGSVASLPVRVVRIKDFLAVVAGSEWDAMSAARALQAKWSDGTGLTGDAGVQAWMKSQPLTDETLVTKGDARAVLAGTAKRVAAEYYWPMQSHASMGPSCAIADVRDGKATIWSASQATHRFRETIARLLDLDRANVRVIYVDGAGCYGMNGHDDAAADAALLSRAIGKPVRVQWTRADELGWDPKGPPQMLALEGAVGDDGRIAAWRTQMWLPRATANLPNIPLLGPQSAGMAQTLGLSTGLISQNGNPPYVVAHQEVVVHWLKDAPLRPSNLRAPGKVANGFAVESFTDELAAVARKDALEFRLAGLTDPRGIEVVKRAAALINWTPRPSPGPGGVGRGIAYIHYKNNETYVAIAMEAEVDKKTGAIRVRRVGCAHDCGLVINPDGVRAQIEGSILQTLSRALHEEVKFDKARVTSVDFATYPLLRFPEVPPIAIDLVIRQKEPPLGAGEAATAPVAAALANAVFDASGVRLRTVPFTPERVLASFG